MQLDQAMAAVQQFCGPNLTTTLARIETSIRGVSSEQLDDAVASLGASQNTLASAGELKRLVGQLNVVVHALGILLCLPKILEPGEVVESVSLGRWKHG